MSVHAMEEMAEDDLDIVDIVRSNKQDPRGTTYTVQGTTLDDKRLVGIVGRFHGASRFLIITVYDINKYH
jgi:hypothetical protein